MVATMSIKIRVEQFLKQPAKWAHVAALVLAFAIALGAPLTADQVSYIIAAISSFGALVKEIEEDDQK
jgi:hypothetical protein